MDDKTQKDNDNIIKDKEEILKENIDKEKEKEIEINQNEGVKENIKEEKFDTNNEQETINTENNNISNKDIQIKNENINEVNIEIENVKKDEEIKENKIIDNENIKKDENEKEEIIDIKIINNEKELNKNDLYNVNNQIDEIKEEKEIEEKKENENNKLISINQSDENKKEEGNENGEDIKVNEDNKNGKEISDIKEQIKIISENNKENETEIKQDENKQKEILDLNNINEEIKQEELKDINIINEKDNKSENKDINIISEENININEIEKNEKEEDINNNIDKNKEEELNNNKHNEQEIKEEIMNNNNTLKEMNEENKNELNINIQKDIIQNNNDKTNEEEKQQIILTDNKNINIINNDINKENEQNEKEKINKVIIEEEKDNKSEEGNENNILIKNGDNDKDKNVIDIIDNKEGIKNEEINIIKKDDENDSGNNNEIERINKEIEENNKKEENIQNEKELKLEIKNENKIKEIEEKKEEIKIEIINEKKAEDEKEEKPDKEIKEVNEIKEENKENNEIKEIKEENKEEVKIIKDKKGENEIKEKEEKKEELEIKVDDKEEKQINKKDQEINIVKEEKKNDNNNNINNNNEKKSINIIDDFSSKYFDQKNIEKITEYNKSNYKKFYSEKHFCDYNSGSQWRAGYIVKISGDHAEVIDATNKSKNGEKFKKKKINMNDSINISYFRKYSKPDNYMAKGSSKNLSNKLEQFSNFHKYFDNYLKNCDNFEFYYFLRVTVYYGLDFCMNPNINKNNNNDNIKYSFILILRILDIIVDCLKIIKDNLNEFLDYHNNIKNSDLNDLVLINKQYAVYSFFDDIHFLIKKIFGDSIEYLDWYIKYKNEINQFNPAAINDPDILQIPFYTHQNGGRNNNNKMTQICSEDVYNNTSHIFNTLDKEISSCIIAYFTDYFSFIGGYKLLFEIVYSIEDLKGEDYSINFNIQNSLINDLYTAKAITDNFSHCYKNENITLKNYAINYIDKFNESNFEKINKDKLSKFFNKIFDLSERNKEEKEKLNENINLNYLFKQIQFAKKLEKKISYLTDLNNIIKSVEYNDLYKLVFENKKSDEALKDQKFKERNRDFIKMDSKFFCSICNKKDIINIFLNDSNIHEEIIKRIPPLLQIMYKNNYGFSNQEKDIYDITNNIFKMLVKKLKEAEKSNENLGKVVKEIIIDFTEILNKNDKYLVFSQIKDYLNESINNKSSKIIQIYNLIINYSLKCIDSDNLKKNNEDNENIFNDLNLDNYEDINRYTFNEKQFYCLEILIDVLLNKNNNNQLNINLEQKKDLMNTCIDGIIEILTKNNFNINIIKIILTKIFNGIISSMNSVSNIILLEKIINLNTKNDKIRNEIKNICEKNNIINSLIKEFFDYLKKVETLNKEKENKSEINNDEDFYDFQTNIEKRLNFLFILLNKEINIQIQENDFNLLFMELNSMNKIVKEIFYSVIKKNILNIDYLFREFIFQNIILNNSNFEVNDIMSYQLLKEFIIKINKSKNVFFFINEKDMIVLINNNLDDIYGYNKLWEIFLQTENREIQEDITNLLKDIYLGIKFSSEQKYKNFWDNITNIIIDNLKKNNDNTIKGLVNLLKKIIDESINDGEIITDKKIIDKLFENFKNDNNKADNELTINDPNTPIKICLEYYSNKKTTNIKKTKNKNNDNNKRYTIDNEIYKNEFFYHLKYYISYAFEIPLKCIEIEVKDNFSTKDKKQDAQTYNLFDDFINIYTSLPGLDDYVNKKNKKDEKPFIFSIKKIKNPMNDENINNLKNTINSNPELIKILMNLLKNKSGNYTKDIWNMIKDKDDFIKNEKGIFKNFNDLINRENNELLNELFNFEDSSTFYMNFILQCFYKFLSNDKEKEKEKVNKLINSNLWKSKLKNLLLDYVNKKKNDNIKDSLLDEKNYVYQILNIYKIIADNISPDNAILDFMANDYFNIYYEIIKDCLNIDLNTLNKQDEDNNIYEIKNYYINILNNINELFINNKNIIIPFIKLIEKDNKNEFNEKFKFCFTEGILKNNYPFLNEKSSQLFISLIKNNKCFSNNTNNDILNIQKKFYLYISSIFFTKEYKEKVFEILKELFNNSNNINNNNVSNNKNNNNNDKIKIYEYNLKLYNKILAEILNFMYKYTYNEYDYDNYIIESVIPYIYEPLLKDIQKESNAHDIYFGGHCEIMYNYIQVMSYNKNLDEDKYKLIFNYKGKNLKEYLFNEIIMCKCDKDLLQSINNYMNGKSIKIINSFTEVSHLFISIIIKEINDNKINNEKDRDLMYYLNKIDYYNKLGYWKGNQISDWKLNFREEINCSTFIGLKNLGCTCYMNSLLQVFYHIIPFRESLLKCNCKEEKKNSLYEVKKIFNSLKYIKDSYYYTPTSIIDNYDDEKLNVHQQMDVDEFFSNILDKLENKLKKTENENIIKYFFQGRLNDNLKFQDGCTHHRTNVNDFYSIQLQVQNKKNIYESLDTLIEGELMNGDNCIFCPKCDKKFPAIKSQCFKTLPRILMFVLKRFEFNYDAMKKIKINDFYEFPLELDMNKYTNEYINNKNDKENNKYSLKSIVVHQGHSEGGHYYAFIKDNLSQIWYKFNDTKVDIFDISKLANETYGGKETNLQTEKNKSAYLLFYEKMDDTNCESFNNIKAIDSLNNNESEEKEDYSLFGETIINDNNENNIDDNTKEMLKNINEEAIINNLNKKLFSNEYHHFTLELYLNILNNIDYEDNVLFTYLEKYNIDKNDHPFQTELYLLRNIKPQGSNLTKYISKGKIKLFSIGKQNNNKNEEEKKEKIIELFKYILIFFFNIIIRSREKKYLGCYVDLIKFLIIRYDDYCANYLLEEFSCYNVIIEYLINCPLYEIKKVIVGIINTAMNKSIQTYNQKEGAKRNNTNNKNEINEIKEINQKSSIQKDNNDIFKNDPKFQRILENDKKIKNIKEEIVNNEKSNGFDFEVISKDDIVDKKKDIKITDEFEIIGDDTDEKDKKKMTAPLDVHYIDILKEEKNNENKNVMNDEEYARQLNDELNYHIKKEKKGNDKFLQNEYISPNVLKLVYNFLYTINTIKFHNRKELRFIYAVLLRFSLINDYTKDFLSKRILLFLNILLFKKCGTKNYSDNDVLNFDKGLFYVSHEILNSKPKGTIYGETDKVGKFITLNYDFMLLCSLSYSKERAKDEVKDIGFSFYNNEYIKLLIQYIDTKQDLNYLSNLIAKKCLDNNNIFDKTLDALKFIIERINDSEKSFYDKIEEQNNNEIYKNNNNANIYFLKRLRNNVNVIFLSILSNKKKDNNDEYRLKNSLNLLFSLFKENKKYYGLSISIINIIIDIFSEENEYTKKRHKDLNEILEWLDKYKVPPKLYDIKGISMYKNENSIMNSFYSEKDIDKKVKEEFKNAEIKKTKRKIEIINRILKDENIDYDISNYNCDLTDFKFTIGDQVIYDNKEYVITDCLDELLRIKLIDNNEKKDFKVKGFNEKKKSIYEKEKTCFWIETDSYNLRIKQLFETNYNNNYKN